MNLASNVHVDDVVERIRQRLAPEESALACRFAELFWSKTPGEDLIERNVEEDVEATIENWRAFHQLPADQLVLSVRNPRQSTRTIVRIIAPDMPFVVDSVLMALSHDGLTMHSLSNAVFSTTRDAQRCLVAVDLDRHGPHRELFIYAELERMEDDALDPLRDRIEATMLDIRACVTDFDAMKAKIVVWLDALRQRPAEEDVTERIAFLEWLSDNHFTFLGYREFRYVDDAIEQVGEQSLGVLRLRPLVATRRLSEQPDEIRRFLERTEPLAFSKSGTLSLVHRPAYPDYIGFKQLDDAGNVIGEFGFLGLYTSRVYLEHPSQIPMIRRKVEQVIADSDLDPGGFDGKVLAQVLTTYPRDELFQIDEDELLHNALAITYIHERRRTRVFTRFDPYGLFVTCLVYVPRNLFNTHVRLQIQALLINAFNAERADYEPHFSESILVRLRFTLRVRPSVQTAVDIPRIESDIVAIMRDWAGELTAVAEKRFGEAEGRKLARRYGMAFPAGYREEFSPDNAADDIVLMERLGPEARLITRFTPPDDGEELFHLKIYHNGSLLPLSDVMPQLENMGLRVIDQVPYSIEPVDSELVSFHDFRLSYHEPLDVDSVNELFDTAFVDIWNARAENDRFNQLILSARLNWRTVALLRAYARYIKQIRFGFSLDFIADTLAKHRKATELLESLFVERFDPNREGGQFDALKDQFEDYLDGVALLNEDRILRRFCELLQATVRTNFFLADRPVIALKIKPSNISLMPAPVPDSEIFVCAPHVEGVHLRAGPIARGGLRWSDRVEDYRTEVLGLVKAQTVKNAVIVPTGAKGGFVAKGGTDGIRAYSDFVSGLLDLTDNIIDGTVVHPEGVRVLDGADPYLVVAADKGTAAFSDTANVLANEYQFWLGDGFASGGSNGYDHKQMGITARGAWISVQRHFAEQGIDVQNDAVSVIGIGDMSGDVFGNGLLLSESVQLVAAFDHRHIFIDPNPDASAGFTERRRLFELASSTWADYDATLLSTGGGIFPREVKSVRVTAEMRERFDIDADALTPDELIHALLQAPVDLIWNGGIGSYVRAADESDDEVGDRVNDHLRVTAEQLRCRVIGEGGNLGLTQRARIVFAAAGGSVNTDFIDNSAGVDCSDHEVNIKILLNEVVAGGQLTTRDRNQLLEAMTGEVTDLVLDNSYHQARALSLAERHALERHDEYRRLIWRLEAEHGLNRELEDLPSDEELIERFTHGGELTRPELAVLLAYSKTHIKHNLAEADVLADPYILRLLRSAFPEQLAEAYPDVIERHRLRPEIVATQIANDIVHQMGMSFVVHMMELIGGSVNEIARAYLAAAECFRIRRHAREIDAQDVSADTRLAMHLELVRLGRRATRWFLRHRRTSSSIDAVVDEFSGTVESLVPLRKSLMGKVTAEDWRRNVKTLVRQGVDGNVAGRTANAAVMAVALPIADAAQAHRRDLHDIAKHYSTLGEALKMDWLTAQLTQLPTTSHWQAMERDSLLDDVTSHQGMLAARTLDGDAGVDAWLSKHTSFQDNWNKTIEDAQQTAVQDFSMFAMTCRKLANLCRTLE